VLGAGDGAGCGGWRYIYLFLPFYFSFTLTLKEIFSMRPVAADCTADRLYGGIVSDLYHKPPTRNRNV
jgi:hypothetical protein